MGQLPELLIAGAAASTMMATLFRAFLLPVYRWVRDVHHVVQTELTPNHGNSMKDRIEVVERIQNLMQRQEAERQEEMYRALDTHVQAFHT